MKKFSAFVTEAISAAASSSRDLDCRVVVMETGMIDREN